MGETIESGLAGVFAEVLADPNPIDSFSEVILNRVDWSRTLHDGSHPGQHWWAQREILAALWDPSVSTIVVPAGHSVGKSFCGASAIMGWVTLQPESLSVSTSPSNTQLSGVLWKEVRRAFEGSPLLKNIGRVTRLPNRFELRPGWEAVGYATNKAERLQGWHSSGPLLVVVDEASGVEDDEIWATIRSLKPRKVLMLGNTLRAYGKFYETYQRSFDDPTVRMIKIPSTLSPDIDQEFSERGLADRTFLRDMRLEYGEGSQMWNIRIAAEFPESTADRLVPLHWLDACARAEHVPRGTRRISIDLGGGNGGDDSVILVRDDNGILDFAISNTVSFGEVAEKVAELARKYGVKPMHISWDVAAIGHDFANRLQQHGLKGCIPYRGSNGSRNPKYFNLRGACHFALRRRLNPEYRDEDNRALPTFSIPPELVARLRKELKEYYITAGKYGENLIPTKDDIKAAVGKSPDLLDTLAQSFAFPYL